MLNSTGPKASYAFAVHKTARTAYRGPQTEEYPRYLVRRRIHDERAKGKRARRTNDVSCVVFYPGLCAGRTVHREQGKERERRVKTEDESRRKTAEHCAYGLVSVGLQGSKSKWKGWEKLKESGGNARR